MGHDALAAGLTPGILGAPGRDILRVLGGATQAGWAISSWAVTLVTVRGLQFFDHVERTQAPTKIK